jgi:hypothetical protein
MRMRRTRMEDDRWCGGGEGKKREEERKKQERRERAWLGGGRCTHFLRRPKEGRRFP